LKTIIVVLAVMVAIVITVLKLQCTYMY